MNIIRIGLCIVLSLVLTSISVVFYPFNTLANDKITYHPEPLRILTAEQTHQFRIEVAQTPAQRSQGLMFRQHMPKDAGMLFCFETIRPVFMWMKDTPLSLDMIFIRKDGTISRIEKNTTPFSEDIIASGEEILMVLEVNAGVTDDLHIKNENRLEHSSIFSCAQQANGILQPPTP